MLNTQLSITNFRLVPNHPYLRALADLSFAGLVVRGIKLEESLPGTFHLGFPGRKVQGQWQLVCESENERAHKVLLGQMEERYAGLQEAA